LGRNTCPLEEAELVVASTISFIQANLQHSMAASRILTRTVGVKGIDVALIQEPWYQGLEHSRLFPLLCKWDRQTSGLHSYEEPDSLDATRILL
jgi:hypothetical protein